jgi:hypothetical protein
LRSSCLVDDSKTANPRNPGHNFAASTHPGPPLFPHPLFPQIHPDKPQKPPNRKAKANDRQNAGPCRGDEYVDPELPRSCYIRAPSLTSTRITDTNSGERQTGRKAQLSNIAAAKTYARPSPHLVDMSLVC